MVHPPHADRALEGSAWHELLTASEHSRVPDTMLAHSGGLSPERQLTGPLGSQHPSC